MTREINGCIDTNGMFWLLFLRVLSTDSTIFSICHTFIDFSWFQSRSKWAKNFVWRIVRTNFKNEGGLPCSVLIIHFVLQLRSIHLFITRKHQVKDIRTQLKDMPSHYPKVPKIFISGEHEHHNLYLGWPACDPEVKPHGTDSGWHKGYGSELDCIISIFPDSH